jgi:hypothetical protein
LFHAAAVPGYLLRSFPLAEIARPSRGHLLPCSYPPTCTRAPLKTLLPAVSPTPTLSRSCLDSRLPMSSLSQTELLVPVALDLQQRTSPFCELHLLRSLTPSANPFAPSRVAPSQRPMLPWSSASLERSPLTPRILRPARTTRARTPDLARRLGLATRGTSRPLAPGETPPGPKSRKASSAASSPLRDWPAPPLGGAPTPSTLELPSKPGRP